VAARDLPITPGDHRTPVARINIFDELEVLAAKGMEFVLSPIVVSQHGKADPKVIGFNLRALGALEDARLQRASVGRVIMADNQEVRRI
jgi:hypothetical protein